MTWQIYITGAVFTAVVIGIAWLVFASYLLTHYVIWFVNDIDRWQRRLPLLDDDVWGGDDIMLALVFGGLAGAVGSFLWPAAWPIAITYGGLLAARSFVRFKKVYQAHKHDEKTGEVR